MPIYGFDCNKCGHQFEKLVRSSETPACPSCNGTDLTRQLSLIAPPAKGGGGDHVHAPSCGGGGGCSDCPNRLN
jgi:putative FmdB family regulatory protein